MHFLRVSEVLCNGMGSLASKVFSPAQAAPKQLASGLQPNSYGLQPVLQPTCDGLQPKTLETARKPNDLIRRSSAAD